MILLPAAWLAAGRGGDEISALSTATLLGSALATLGVGLVAHRVAPLRVLLAACALLTLTGLGFAFAPSFGWLLAIAFVGTFNPSVGDLSVFLPTEQALLAGSGAPEQRATRFARYNVAGSARRRARQLAAPGNSARSASGSRRALTRALLAYAALGGVLALLYAPLRAAARLRATTARSRSRARAAP